MQTTLWDILHIRKWTSITKKKVIDWDFPVIAWWKKPAYFHNESNRDSPVVTFSASWANAWYVNYFDTPVFASDCSTVESGANIYLKFIYYFLRSKQQYIYDNLQRWAWQPHVYPKDISKLEINLPTLQTQKVIAKKLDHIQSLIDQKKESIAKTEELGKSIFVEMFGDPVKNDMWFETINLDEIWKIIWWFAFKSWDLKGDDWIPVIKIWTVNSWFFDINKLTYFTWDTTNLTRYEIYNWDLLMSLTWTVWKEDYWNICKVSNEYEKYYLNQRVWKIDFDKNVFDTKFLFYLFRDQNLKREIISVSRWVRQANISNTDIYALDLICPEMRLQKKFSDMVTCIEIKDDEDKKSLLKLETLLAQQMQESFAHS